MVIQTSPLAHHHRGPVRYLPRSKAPPARRLFISVALLATFAVAAVPACAQLQQPFSDTQRLDGDASAYFGFATRDPRVRCRH